MKIIESKGKINEEDWVRIWSNEGNQYSSSKTTYRIVFIGKKQFVVEDISGEYLKIFNNDEVKQDIEVIKSPIKVKNSNGQIEVMEEVK